MELKIQSPNEEGEGKGAEKSPGQTPPGGQKPGFRRRETGVAGDT